MWINVASKEFPYGKLIQLELPTIESIYITKSETKQSGSDESKIELCLHIDTTVGNNYTFSGSEDYIVQCYNGIFKYIGYVNDGVVDLTSDNEYEEVEDDKDDEDEECDYDF